MADATAHATAQVQSILSLSSLPSQPAKAEMVQLITDFMSISADHTVSATISSPPITIANPGRKCYLNTVVLLLSSITPLLPAPPMEGALVDSWSKELFLLLANCKLRIPRNETSENDYFGSGDGNDSSNDPSNDSSTSSLILSGSQLYAALGPEHSTLDKGGDSFAFYLKILKEYGGGILRPFFTVHQMAAMGTAEGVREAETPSPPSPPSPQLRTKSAGYLSVNPSPTLSSSIASASFHFSSNVPLPSNIVIRVRRFIFEDPGRGRVKNSTRMILPEELIVEKESFELRGVILHIGEIEQGHSTVILKRGVDWYKIDDNTVEKFGYSQEGGGSMDEVFENSSLLLYAKSTGHLASDNSASDDALALSSREFASRVAKNIEKENLAVLRRNFLSRNPQLHDYLISLLPNSKTSLIKSLQVSPHRCIKRRVSVLFKNGAWYEGTITSYDEEDNKHRVDFDDGTTGNYKIHKKAMKFI